MKSILVGLLILTAGALLGFWLLRDPGAASAPAAVPPASESVPPGPAAVTLPSQAEATGPVAMERREVPPPTSEPSSAPALDEEPVLVKPFEVTLLELDMDRNPVPEARVEVFDGRKGRPAIQEGKTDLTGRHALQLDRKLVYVTVRKEGVGTSGDVPLRYSQGPTDKDWIVTLEPEITLRGQVLFADGRPAVGAKVRVSASGWRYVANRGQPPEVAPLEADLHGRFTTTLMPFAIYKVSATFDTEKSPPASVDTMKVEEREKEVVLRFLGAFSVRGVLVDPQGRPVAGRLRLWEDFDQEKARASPAYRSFQGSATAGTEGQFEIKVEQASGYRLIGSAPGFANSDFVQVAVTETKPRPDVLVRVQAGKEIRGRVLRADATPMPGVKVFAGPEAAGAIHRVDSPQRQDDYGSPDTVTTGADGSFVFPCLHPATTWRLSCVPDEKKGNLRITRSGLQPGGEPVEIVVTDEELQGSRLVVNVVSAATGEPVLDVRLGLLRYDGDQVLGVQDLDAVPDANGRFVVEGRPLHQKVGVIVRSSMQHAAAILGPITLTQDEHEVTLRLQRYGVIRVLLLDADGKPVINLPVQTRSDEQLPGVGWFAPVPTDSQGISVLRRAPGRHTLLVVRGEQQVDLQSVEVPPGGQVELTLRLPK
jgi:hypothetical protein